jgi:putative phage-type endonuclease
MKQELKLEHGSQEWLEFRRNYRMASETPAIMGLSPYQSPADVRAAKQGKSAYVNPAMRQGTEQEPLARAAYEALYEPMRTAVFVSGEYGCSLDGINISEDLILEIKTPYKDARNSDRWKAAERGELTPADYAQVQHQLMVAGSSGAHFMVWDAETQTSIVVPIEPSPDYWQTIRAAWDAFWPTLEAREDAEWLEAASEYRAAKEALDKATADADAAKKRLIDMAVGDFSHGGGVEVKKIGRSGSIDWAAIQKKYLQEVDVEPFRKEGTSYFEVKVRTF